MSTDDTTQDRGIHGDMSGLDAERKLISLDKLQPDPYQSRRKVSPDDDFWSLVESIKENGMMNDLIVRPVDCTDVGDYSDRRADYLIVAGSRRFRALMQTDHKGMEVPCKVIEVDDDEAARMFLSDNIHRKDLSDYELVRAVAIRYDQLAERLVPEDEPGECLKCGKEYNGRQGLKTHINRSDDEAHERSDNLSDLFLSTREIHKEIANGEVILDHLDELAKDEVRQALADAVGDIELVGDTTIENLLDSIGGVEDVADSNTITVINLVNGITDHERAEGIITAAQNATAAATQEADR